MAVLIVAMPVIVVTMGAVRGVVGAVIVMAMAMIIVTVTVVAMPVTVVPVAVIVVTMVVMTVAVVVMAVRGQGVTAGGAGRGRDHRVHIAGVMGVVIAVFLLVDAVVLHGAELATALVAGAVGVRAIGQNDQQDQRQQGQGAADGVLAGDLAHARQAVFRHPGEGQGLQRGHLEGGQLEALGGVLGGLDRGGDELLDRTDREGGRGLGAFQLQAVIGPQRSLLGGGRLDLPGEGRRLAGGDGRGLLARRADLVALALQVGVGVDLFGGLAETELGGLGLDHGQQIAGQGQDHVGFLAGLQVGGHRQRRAAVDRRRDGGLQLLGRIELWRGRGGGGDHRRRSGGRQRSGGDRPGRGFHGGGRGGLGHDHRLDHRRGAPAAARRGGYGPGRIAVAINAAALGGGHVLGIGDRPHGDLQRAVGLTTGDQLEPWRATRSGDGFAFWFRQVVVLVAVELDPVSLAQIARVGDRRHAGEGARAAGQTIGRGLGGR